MTPSPARRRLATTLFATTIATYVLIALGTAVSTTASGDACGTWPSCASGWAAGPVTGDGLLFVAHRGTALLAGVLLFLTIVYARRVGVDRLTGGGIALAAIVFPIQVGVGGLLVVRPAATIGVVHLALAVAIFGALLLALVRTLEATFPTDSATQVRAERPLEPLGPEAFEHADVTPGETGSGRGHRNPADEGATVTTAGRFTGVHRYARAYVTLMKPRLMWLLCLVAGAGIALAVIAGGSIVPSTVAATLLGGVLAIGASGTFNHVYERDRDRLMERTADRPLVHDVVPGRNALAFGFALLFVSTAIMYVWVNTLATVLTLAAVAYYSVVYTVVLKPSTSWNTVIGGGAGALPALIGWVAVTGEVGLSGLVLAAVIFLWTPAHFYSLAIAHKRDYARGGYPMLPVVAGDRVARRHIVVFLGATLIAASVLGWIAGLGLVYAGTSVALGAVFLRSVIGQYSDRSHAAAKRSFYVSNYYLGAILVAIVLEAFIAAA